MLFVGMDACITSVGRSMMGLIRLKRDESCIFSSLPPLSNNGGIRGIRPTAAAAAAPIDTSLMREWKTTFEQQQQEQPWCLIHNYVRLNFCWMCYCYPFTWFSRGPRCAPRYQQPACLRMMFFKCFSETSLAHISSMWWDRAMKRWQMCTGRWWSITCNLQSRWHNRTAPYRAEGIIYELSDNNWNNICKWRQLVPQRRCAATTSSVVRGIDECARYR